MADLPMYRQIAGDLRGQIARGDLRPGDPVPSEAQLARDYGVTRMTARQGLMSLEQAGLLAPGRPRTIARHEPLVVHITRSADLTHPGESPTLGADAWAGDMIAAGREPVQSVTVFTRAAEPGLARRLELAAHSIVIARRLVREAGGSPHSLVTFWFPLSVTEDTPLSRPDAITEGSLAWLEKTYGTLEHEVRIAARMPLPEEAAELAIDGGWPVMIVWRTSRTSERPVVASMAVYPADRTELLIRL